MMIIGNPRVSVGFLILVVVAVKAQNRCTTPDGVQGDCKNVYQCNHVIELIKKTQTEASPNLLDKLKKFECGRDTYAVKVCCPILSDDVVDSIGPPDVTTHRNLNLLPKNCGMSNSEDRVINGVKADLSEFPWMVLISYRTGNGLEFKCGGTVINDKYVLTAAHCITKLKSTLSLAGVRIGEHDILTEKDCQVYDNESFCAEPVQDLAIEEIVPHPQFDAATTANDIGLIRVRGKINLKQENIGPVCLPIKKEDRLRKLGIVTVTGWGRTETASKSNVLMKVALDIVNPSVCQEFYTKIKRTLTNKQMCASRLGKDSCDGDSGGPLMGFATETGEVRSVQYGIVSFGPVICAQKGSPAVYTDVRHYMKWVLDNIRP